MAPFSERYRTAAVPPEPGRAATVPFWNDTGLLRAVRGERPHYRERVAPLDVVSGEEDRDPGADQDDRAELLATDEAAEATGDRPVADDMQDEVRRVLVVVLE